MTDMHQQNVGMIIGDENRAAIPALADGRAGIVDLSDDLWGDDLEPLRDPGTFAELALDESLATLSWERGGIDISPSYLYSKLESVQ